MISPPSSSARPLVRWPAILLAVFFVSACASASPVSSSEELQAAYRRAVKDAATAEPDEIDRDLTAIKASQPELIWQGRPGKSRVLVVTWTNWAGYRQQVGQVATNERVTWVTIAPELQVFCRKYQQTAAGLDLRLKQLLGLPPDSLKNWLVEIWADPRDLFRPCPDPEITDHECELDFPQSDYFLKVSDPHIQWFNDLQSRSYGADGFPWTRLGYTYDWGNPQSEIGLSEFAIRASATVQIHSVTTIEAYCR